MTDKELFKKAEKIFNLNENIVEKCYKNGQFNKILNENIGSSARASKQVGNPDFKKSGGSLLGGLARGIGSAVKAPFKLAAAGGRGYRQAQSEKARMQRAKAEANRAREIAKQEKIKTKIAKRGLKQKPAANNYVNSSTLLTPSTSKTISKNNLSKRDNILNNVKAGDTIALTLAKDQDNVARIVKIISVSDDKITVNDTRKKSSSNYTINKGNIKDVDYFRK
jgi:hypothetical protein